MLERIFKRQKPLITVYHYTAIFMTVDGKIHFNHKFRYLYTEGLSCTGSEYLMLGKKYLTDDDGVMYPMENIISIKWEVDDSKEVELEHMGWSSFIEIFYD